MTGGVTVVLGSIGSNFGAGMTGGMAYLYDPDQTALDMINAETLVTSAVEVQHWQSQLHELVSRHAEETGSAKAKEILLHWENELGHFLQICPKEMLVHLPHPLSNEATSLPAE